MKNENECFSDTKKEPHDAWSHGSWCRGFGNVIPQLRSDIFPCGTLHENKSHRNRATQLYVSLFRCDLVEMEEAHRNAGDKVKKGTLVIVSVCQSGLT